MIDSNYVGTLTEQRCMLKCLEKGFQVSKPLLASSKYDFILDTGKNILKIQVKTSRPKGQGVFIDCRNRHHSTKYEPDEIDLFMTEADGNYYLIPVDGSRQKCVSDDFLFERMIEKF